MPDTGDPDDRLRQVVAWTITHLEVEANFEGVDSLVIGDPAVLANIELPVLVTEPWAWLPGEHTGVTVRGPRGQGDGPFLWVMGTDDGPVESVQISPELRMAPRGSTPRSVGSFAVPSGRLVIGNRLSVRLWGPTVDLEERAVAEFRVADETPALVRDGYIVVVRLPGPGNCEVFVQEAREAGEIAGVTIRAPRQPWLPPQTPMLRKGF